MIQVVGLPLAFTDYEAIKAFIANNESSLYEGKNVDGEKVAVLLDQGKGMDVYTYQANGWIRVTSYDKDGFSEGETFNGRWDKGGRE